MGKTERPAHVRFTEHRNSVKPESSTSVGQHFSQQGHGVHDMVFLAFEKVASTALLVIEARESHWISRYNSVNEGLNIKR